MITTRRPRRAFTLLELLVAIGVVAVLIGVLLPALGAHLDAPVPVFDVFDDELIIRAGPPCKECATRTAPLCGDSGSVRKNRRTVVSNNPLNTAPLCRAELMASYGPILS